MKRTLKTLIFASALASAGAMASPTNQSSRVFDVEFTFINTEGATTLLSSNIVRATPGKAVPLELRQEAPYLTDPLPPPRCRIFRGELTDGETPELRVFAVEPDLVGDCPATGEKNAEDGPLEMVHGLPDLPIVYDSAGDSGILRLSIKPL